MKETKFKVGDKVRVTDLGIKGGISDYIGCTGLIVKFTKSIAGNHDGYSILFDGENSINHFVWFDYELEFVAEKDNLKDGMVVEFRNGWRALVVAKTFLSESGYYNYGQFTDDLLSSSVLYRTNNKPSMDIIKIYRVKNNSALDILGVFRSNNLTLIWERKEEEPITEMTVAEIEEKLGYKVKVIADKE